MSYFKWVLKWIVNILSVMLLLLLILAVYGKASAVFGGKAYPNYFGYTFFSVASGSMEPTLQVNDVILVKLGQDDIKENDIITYTKNDEIITHRVLGVNEDVIAVKGDNNNTLDAPINRNQIIGKTIKIFPKLSIWQKVLSEPKILLVLFATLLLFDFAISYKGNDKKKKKSKKQKKVKEEPDEDEEDDEEELEEEKESKKEKNKEAAKEKEKKETSEEKEEKEEEDKEEVKIKQVNTKSKDKLDSDELLEYTRTVDVTEIKQLLNEEKERQEKEKREKELDYTVRLDLNEIQKNIRKKVK